MLYGGKIEFKGKIATAIIAAPSSESMQDQIAAISGIKNNYSEITQLTGMDRIKMPIFKGIKNPITIFIHDTEIERDDFISVNEINIVDRADWEYRQERMAIEDDIQRSRDEHDIIALDELSGIENHSSVAKRLGIDVDDPWDTMTAKEKEEALLNSASQYRELVESGMLMDEAIAPAASQQGSIESAIANMIENIKNGGKFIDPSNIPPQLQNQIDEMIEKGDLREEDVERFINDMNDRMKEHCENNNVDEIMRVVGLSKTDESGIVDGKVFIHTKRSDQKQLSAPDANNGPSEIEQRLMRKKSADELASIMKASTIDGSLKTDPEQYVFDNTSMDKHDFREAMTDVKASSSGKNVNFDENSLPENIGSNSEIKYDSSTQEFAYHAKLIDEDSGLYAFFPKGIGVKITAENIIGTNNVGLYMVSDDGCVCFNLKDVTYKTAYFVVKDNKTIIFNINV